MNDVQKLVDGLSGFTPGPWDKKTVTTSCGVCHQIGPWPHEWRHGKEMSACIYDDYPSSGGTGNMIANAALIAAAPELHAAVVALIADNAKLRAAWGALWNAHAAIVDAVTSAPNATVRRIIAVSEAALIADEIAQVAPVRRFSAALEETK